jgi:hypothetical protein
MKPQAYGCSLRFHSKSIERFRVMLGFISIYRGVKMMTMHSLFFFPKDRVVGNPIDTWHGDQSKIDLFQASSSEYWPKFLLLLHVYCGFQLFHRANACSPMVSVFMFLFNNSVIAHLWANHNCGEIFLSLLYFMSGCLPTDAEDDSKGRGKWYETAVTRSYYVIVITLYVIAGAHKLMDKAWTSGEAMQLTFFEPVVGPLGMYARDKWGTLWRLLTHSTFCVEGVVPLLLLSCRTRLFAVLTLMSLHIGIALLYEIGMFPYISLCSLVVLLPPSTNDVWYVDDTVDEVPGSEEENAEKAMGVDGNVPPPGAGLERKGRGGKRSKTPSRKLQKGTVKAAGNNVKADEGTFRGSSKPTRCSRPSLKSTVAVSYTLLFVLQACQQFYDHAAHVGVVTDEMKNMLPAGGPFLREANAMMKLFEVTCRWGVFTMLPEDFNFGWFAVKSYRLPAKVCAKRLVDSKTAIGPRESCTWVDLKYALGTEALSERMFPPLVDKFFRSLLLPAHKYLTVWSGWTSAASSFSPDRFNKALLPMGLVLPELSQDETHTNNEDLLGGAKFYRWIGGQMWGPNPKISFRRDKLMRYLCNRLHGVTSTVNGIDYVFTMPVIETVRQVTYLRRSNDSSIFIPHGCPHVKTDVSWSWSCRTNSLDNTRRVYDGCYKPPADHQR